jgi:hypothetical protein
MRVLLCFPRLLAAPTLLAFVLAAAPGCGECSFEEVVSGTIRDAATGAPLEGVKVEACHGDRCAASPSDEPCASTVTDAEGRFTLDVPQCRPHARECGLRPLVITRDGCDALTARPDRGKDASLELECGV